jgi:hypothetical protein
LVSDRGPFEDPWEHITFDENFVRSSPVAEPSAEERLRELARQARAEELARRLEAEAYDLELARSNARVAARRSVVRRWTASFVILALVAGLIYWTSTRDGSDGGVFASHTADRLLGPRVGTDRPSPSPERELEPLGVAPSPSAARGSFEFLATNPDGTPVAYDPCVPIHYVVNHEHEPPGAEGLVAEAIERTSEATGLVFVDDGTTDESPGEPRDAYQPGRYGDRWAPLLIAWTTPDVVADLRDETAGLGGSAWLSGLRPADGGIPRSAYVSGVISLDGPQFAAQLLPERRDVAVAVIQHELGHVVGLDHVDDPNELMHPTTSNRTQWGPGDRQGLAALGRGACFPDL